MSIGFCRWTTPKPRGIIGARLQKCQSSSKLAGKPDVLVIRQWLESYSMALSTSGHPPPQGLLSLRGAESKIVKSPDLITETTPHYDIVSRSFERQDSQLIKPLRKYSPTSSK